MSLPIKKIAAESGLAPDKLAITPRAFFFSFSFFSFPFCARWKDINVAISIQPPVAISPWKYARHVGTDESWNTIFRFLHERGRKGILEVSFETIFAIALNEICVIVKCEDDSMIKIWNGFRIAKEDNLRFEELGTRKKNLFNIWLLAWDLV